VTILFENLRCRGDKEDRGSYERTECVRKCGLDLCGSGEGYMIGFDGWLPHVRDR
jgi:hypothetical protein